MSTKTFGFGLKVFKKYPELIPLVSIVVASSSIGIGFIVYSLKSKPDVRVLGRNIDMPWEEVLPTESRKLYDVYQKYEPIPELEKLRKEIGRFKS